MSETSKAFLRELHKSIENEVAAVMAVISGGSSQVGNLPWLAPDENAVLRNITLTPRQREVLEKTLREMGRLIIFGMLCIIDGVAYTSEDIPDLAIVNRSTGEDIADQFLHDEFHEVITE